jgi:F-type H+-transporting ATPase subunit b
MPQLQPGDFAPQLIWLAIAFFVLMYLLSQFAIPRIEQTITARKKTVGGDIEKAREAQDQADRIKADYEEALAAARAKAQGFVREARAKLDAEISQKRTIAEREMSEKVKSAEAAIKASVDKASSDMEGIASGVVNDIVTELAGIEVSDAEIAAALRQGVKR